VDPQRLSDEDLLRVAARDVEAFAELYRRHVHRVVAFAVRRCTRPEEVPDLVAAVWLEVIDSAERFDPARGRAVPWLLGIAANLSANDARRRAREREALQRLAGRRVLDEDDYQRLEARIDAVRVAPGLRDAIDALPPGERAVVELVVLDELSPAQAAGALGIVPAAARMRLARARRKLRDALGDGLGADESLEAIEKVAP
jgi:RNA polymerase sigma-70 factor (ECF subfamily)